MFLFYITKKVILTKGTHFRRSVST